MDSRERVLQDTCTSYWLRDALKAALRRDPVDALHDAKRLVDLLKAELVCLQGEVR